MFCKHIPGTWYVHATLLILLVLLAAFVLIDDIRTAVFRFPSIIYFILLFVQLLINS